MKIPEASASSSSLPPQLEKFACILLKNTRSHDLEWYTFDVSDDLEHDQPATSQPVRLCYPFLPPPAPYHVDKETVVEFKQPTATAKYDLRGWAISGLSNKKILYRIHAEAEASGVNYFVGHGFCCIDLLSSTSTTATTTMQQPMTEWEGLRPVPNKLAIDDVEEAAAHILVLSGKVYCLGGSTKKRRRKEEKLRSP